MVMVMTMIHVIVYIIRVSGGFLHITASDFFSCSKGFIFSVYYIILLYILAVFFSFKK